MADLLELVTYSSDPAIAVSGEQRILAINEAATELLGRGIDEALALTCDQLLKGKQADGGALCCAQCKAIDGLRHLRPYANSKCFIQRADGSRFAAKLRTMAIPVDAANPTGPVAIIFFSPADTVETPVGVADPRLRIQALGRFSVSLRGSILPLERWPRKQSIQLLKLLAAGAGRPFHRDRLIEHFWPETDSETGWARLKVTIHFLRQKLREAGCELDVISTTDSSYVLRPDCVVIDARVFDDLAREGRTHQRTGRIADAIRCYEDAKSIYRGDFMEGDLYADWCAEDRERLREVYIELLNTLAELHYDRREFAAAALECHAALAHEPCRESMHRVLLKSLVALGRQDSAIGQFNRCREILLTELGVPPGPETVAVVAPLLAAASQRALTSARGPSLMTSFQPVGDAK